MAILSGLVRDSILKALVQIDATDPTQYKQNEPTKYILIHEDKRYPPKVVVSYAYRIQYGKELPVSEFSGGERRANLILRNLGFNIVKIDSAEQKLTGKWLAVTTEEDWKKCLEDGTWGASEKLSKGLRNMKLGDEMVVYIKKFKTAGIFKVTREYFYNPTRKWKRGMFPHRIGFSPTDRVPPNLIDIRHTFYSQIQPIIRERSKEGSPRGYFGQGTRPLPIEEFAIFEKEILKQIGKGGSGIPTASHHYVTGYDAENLLISKHARVIGWIDKPSSISIGDHVFVYNSTDRLIESCFTIVSKSNNTELIWHDEKAAGKVIYNHRWDAKLSFERIDFDLEKIRFFPPFKDGEDFSLLIRARHPRSIDDPKYRSFLEALLARCAELGQHQFWKFDIEKVVNEILRVNQANELAIDRAVVRRILAHLKAGKNVILVGPPGVGKTDLARQIMTVLGRRITNKDFEYGVATDEWSRFHTVGGMDLAGKFQEGYITRAARDGKWLLIDEFNRANMNKAFGDMFMAVEYGTIRFRPHEHTGFGGSIEIPPSFRMVCTMNDFDKNLLLSELSYGLISRFAFVSVVPNYKLLEAAEIEKLVGKEKAIVEKRVKSELHVEAEYNKYDKQIATYFQFIAEVRKERYIGTRTSLDIAKYLVAAAENSDDQKACWQSLNDALCDYVLPQFDRLDSKTLMHVVRAAANLLKDDAFDPFKSEVSTVLDKLKRASSWLSKDGT